MNNATNRVGTSSTHLRRRCVWVAFALCAVVFASGHAWAEPVTFRFEAEIHTISEFANPSFNQPFDIFPGDVIYGEVSLEQGTGSGPQLAKLKLSFGDVALHTSSYSFALLDNISTQLEPFTYDGPYTGPIEVIPPEVLRAADTGVAPLIDRVYLVCNPEGSFCPPDSVAGTNNILWQPVLNLTGPDGTIPDAVPPLDAKDWNVFSSRSLSIGLVAEGQPAGSYIITASVGQFRAVPEPATIFILGFWTGAVLLIQRRRSNRCTIR